MAKVGISRSKRYGRKIKFRPGKVSMLRKQGMKIPNKFVFKRQGVECKLINTATGAVAISTPASGWSIGTPSADDNGLYQFGGAMQFQLDQVQAAGDFTQLFDRYKISGCKVKFVPLTTMSTSGATVPTISYAIDLDDASVPAAYGEVNQKYNVHKKRLDRPCAIYLKPRLAQAIYSGLTAGYAIGAKNTYVDCNDPGVPHYGIKFWLRDVYLGPSSGVAANLANTIVRIETTFYLSMKDSQ